MAGGASSRDKELYEFGPFVVDVEKELLFRDGEPVALTPKNFQILLVLLRRGQELVTKEELMNAVWPDTFVEEANLSRNIFMLRKALGDSSQDRYIVTVPGRGYRLAENVRVVGQEPALIAVTQSRVEVEVSDDTRWRGWIYAAVMLVAVAAGGVYWAWSHRHPLLTAKDTIVVADFTNSTGDQVFDETLRQGLAVQLEQSPFLSLVSDGRIQKTLTLMGRPSDTHLTPAVAREVCERTGSAVVLEGSIALLGSEYVLGLRARNCRTGDIIREEQVEAKRKEDVLTALGTIASKFRKQLGETIETIEKFDTPLPEATTGSLDALKAFSTGMKVHFAAGASASKPFFQHAVEIDPQFAMAHAFLGRIYGDLGEFESSAASITRAYELRNRASEHERFFIATNYDLQVRGNLEAAEETVEAWQKAYPRDALPHAFLGGIIYPDLGKYAQATEQAKAAVEGDPDFFIAYEIYSIDLAAQGQLDNAEEVVQRAAARGLDTGDIAIQRYDLAFLRGDETALRQAAENARTKPGAELGIAQHEAFVAAYHGRLREARRLSEHATALAIQVKETERAAQFAAGEAVREAMCGNFAQAKQKATAALQLSRDRDVAYGAALALVMAGETARAQSLMADLEKSFPEDTSRKFNYSPVLRALLAMQNHDPAKAIEELQVASNYEMATPRSANHAFFGALYPVYVRGEAYLAAHDGGAAAREFQKIIDHPGIVVSDVVGALAYLQIARAYAFAGEREKARSAYQKFLSLWGGADSDVPVQRQAKAEFARL